jgi:hypothetical protein
MKHIITLLVFAAPFVVNAQEPPAKEKKSNTPPSSEKSISEKGVSSTKSRGISTKKTTTGTPTPPPATTTETKTATPSGSNTATTSEKPKN